jgi:hypothetical protein
LLNPLTSTPAGYAVLGTPNLQPVTITDVYDTPTWNKLFYYFHAGYSPGFPASASQLTLNNIQYILPTGGSPTTAPTGFYQTSSLSEAMSLWIDTVASGNAAVRGFIYPLGTFQIPGTIPQAGQANFQWTYPATTSSQNYYLAVPDNSPNLPIYYEEDLTTGGHLKYSGQNVNANSARKQFVYNGNKYWLYFMNANAQTSSITYGFSGI